MTGNRSASDGVFKIGDLDNDTDIDDLLDQRRWFENLGTGFSSTTHPLEGSHIPFRRHDQLFDIDQDGDLDRISQNWEGIVWRENLGRGVFGLTNLIYKISENVEYEFAIMELEDSRSGLIITSNSDDSIYYGEILPATNWTGPNLIDPRSHFNHISLGSHDVDGDGDVDLLATRIDSSLV